MSEQITPLYEHVIAGLRPMLRQITVQDWRGTEYVPRTDGFVVSSNHLSYLDPFVLAHFLVDQGRAPHFLAKSSLFKPPGVRQAMEGTGQIPVYRGTARAVDAFSAALKAIANGACVCVLPEGTLTRDPDLWPMTGKSGAARIALETGCPLLPVGVWGTQDVLWPYRGRVPRLLPRKTIHVYAGPPVDLDDLRGQQVTGGLLKLATERLMDAITAQVALARRMEAPETRWNPNEHGGYKGAQ
ncbi:1-acyl-sn-glycerol-3-phosphate acyltransferase [Leekyejoonella antrihumi]|uniref:1-acyl-sn-glycerol-3-phosphate acyltransferase n=2 Tax=Leekyejoonella antrihumi TaxID=1660198 RepID=A0A563DZU3_9MICO|nr:1-acyl-sn-glycerol-3-phosphate acyltransferase [Leekyejoonella antrihumi]